LKIAFCLKENRPDSPLDERFGRASWFALVDAQEGKVLEIVENTAQMESAGAGSLAVQILLDHGAETIIAPEFGPISHEALKTFKVELFKQGAHRTIDSALKAWEEGTLEKAEKAGAKGLHKA